MNLTEFINLLKKLDDGTNLTNEEQTKLDCKAEELVQAMQNGNIDFDSQNALDYYVSFFEYSKTLSINAVKVINTYNNIVEENKLNNGLKNTNNSVLIMKPIKDKTGTIKIITIIYMTILFGLFVAALILALTTK